MNSTAEAGVFLTSLRLGLTSFGGPVAHLGYFERVYVRERRWITAEAYAELLALCQFLPGPTSSQVGFLIGLRQAGIKGALAAWVGFTLPSALLMYAFALFVPHDPGTLMQAVIHGLMLSAVAVVAQAVLNMARTLCPDWERTGIAILAGALLLFRANAAAQMVALSMGAAAGWFLCRRVNIPAIDSTPPVRPRSAWLGLATFVILLLILPLLAALAPHTPLALAAIFYRAGALVFGGGHVVLPLLRQALVPDGWISDDTFLAGYGFAQAMPGPLFTVAAYLGAASAPPNLSGLWAALALFAMFLPGLLLCASSLSLWGRLKQRTAPRAILAGVNASAVGILAAALYNPVWTGGVRNAVDAAVVVVGFVLLLRWRTPPIAVVALCVVTSLPQALML